MKTKDKVLEQIRLGNSSASGIAEVIGIDKGTVSFHVRSLIASGLVQKSGRDYRPSDGSKSAKTTGYLDDTTRTEKLKLILAILPDDQREEIIGGIISASGVQDLPIDFNALIQSYGGLPFRLLAKAHAFNPEAPLRIADAFWNDLGLPVVLSYSQHTQPTESQQHP